MDTTIRRHWLRRSLRPAKGGALGVLIGTSGLFWFMIAVAISFPH